MSAPTSAKSASDSPQTTAPGVEAEKSSTDSAVKRAASGPTHRWRRWLAWTTAAVLVVVAAIAAVPWTITAFTTVSTDDAYVNGHVTIVAPRVAGQVTRVLVDDN